MAAAQLDFVVDAPFFKGLGFNESHADLHCASFFFTIQGSQADPQIATYMVLDQRAPSTCMLSQSSLFGFPQVTNCPFHTVEATRRR